MVSRLSLVLSIIRQFISDYKNSRFDRDELTNELYIYVEGLIKSNPFVDNDELTRLGIKFCSTWVNKHSHNRARLDYNPREHREFNNRFHSSDNLLSLWCSASHKRQGKKWQSRIMGYLHYVESLPYEEIAEIFGVSTNAVISTVYNIHKPRNKTMLKKNDIVLLVMNNPFFNHMLAWVKEPTEWGAIVEVESHCYPHRKRWELRATENEMVYIGSLAKLPETPKIPESIDGNKMVLSNAQAALKPEHVYTAEEKQQLEKILDTKPIKDFKPAHIIHTPKGDIPNGLHDPNVYLLQECPQCGQMKLRHNGPCLVCDACGTTTGCG